MRSHAATILEFFRRFNDEDVDGVLDLFADDAEFSMGLFERELRGRAELKSFLLEHLAAWSAHREWATSVIVEGDVAASELHFDGTTRGGVAVSMDNLNVWEFRDGLIVRVHVYADRAPLERALA